ncbi:bifunctional DNA primase/polymerase [Saccharopolyspora sp. NPDC003762]
MTRFTSMSTSDNLPTKRKRSESELAAVQYAGNGWPVLPGSVYDGQRFVEPGTRKVTRELRPVVARNLATTDPEQAARYWAVADERLVPTVLLCSGPAFRLVSVAGNLAQWVLKTEIWESQPGPVLYRGDLGRAFFLVDNRELSVRGPQPDEVVELARGDWTAAPPSRTRGVNVIWWTAPENVDWCPAWASVLGAALTLGCRNRSAARRSVEVRARWNS